MTTSNNDILVLDFSDGHYLVRRKNKKPYEVVKIHNGYTCDCPDWTFRKSKYNGVCVHIRAVKDFISVNTIRISGRVV